MRVLVIPDIHLKPEIIQNAMTKMPKYDRAVFLGDFVDDWGKERNIGLYDQTFDALNEFLSAHPDSLVCYGNHDVSYEWDKLESGFSAYAYATVNARLNELRRKHKKGCIQFVHRIDNVLFSHAGLTRGFLLQNKINDINTPIDEILDIVNKMPDRLLWDNASPIWARPDDGYAYYSRGMLQVVGHTPVTKAKYDEEKHLLITDTFSTWSNGTPYGDRKFTWVDTETMKWGTG